MFAFASAIPLARASAFAGARTVSPARAAQPARFFMTASRAIPFAEKPPKLDGTLAGDVGFDPLGFSSKFDVNFLRESELKHGRISMLAFVGWVFPELVYHLPDSRFAATNPLEAVTRVGFLPIAQILLFIAVCEAPSVKKVFDNNCENPGNYGIDPLGLSKDPSKRKYYELAEVKNGRLAMIAIGGAIHHTLLTNMGLVEQLAKGEFTGGYYIH